jgi:uncharacterized protein YkwD
MFGLNYIDLLIILVIFYHCLRGYQIGFWVLFARLISFIAAILIAVRSADFFAQWILDTFGILPVVAFAIGYIIPFILSQFIVSFVLNKLFDLIPEKIRYHISSYIAGIIPGFLDGVIFVFLMLLMVYILPIPDNFQNDIKSSRISSSVSEKFPAARNYLNAKLGGLLDETLKFTTLKPESSESISIPYKPSKLTVDEEAEIKMLELVNAERARVGAKPLVMDKTIIPVARAHSDDMWQRGYFSHTNPDGEDPFDRMREGKVKFLRAGENLALAPNVEIAHRGLMNSPGHKRNILDPKFGRVGIGVIDGGIYGQMYTQNFAD